jgi:hypothetical protein
MVVFKNPHAIRTDAKCIAMETEPRASVAAKVGRGAFPALFAGPGSP